MKIYSRTKITVVGKAEPTHSGDGKSTYYRVAVMQNGQATNLMVSELVYNAIPDGMVDVVFLTSYDDKYQSFRVDDLVETISVNGQPYGKSAPASTPAPDKAAK